MKLHSPLLKSLSEKCLPTIMNQFKKFPSNLSENVLKQLLNVVFLILSSSSTVFIITFFSKSNYWTDLDYLRISILSSECREVLEKILDLDRRSPESAGPQRKHHPDPLKASSLTKMLPQENPKLPKLNSDRLSRFKSHLVPNDKEIKVVRRTGDENENQTEILSEAIKLYNSSAYPQQETLEPSLSNTKVKTQPTNLDEVSKENSRSSFYHVQCKEDLNGNQTEIHSEAINIYNINKHLQQQVVPTAYQEGFSSSTEERNPKSLEETFTESTSTMSSAFSSFKPEAIKLNHEYTNISSAEGSFQEDVPDSLGGKVLDWMRHDNKDSDSSVYDENEVLDSDDSTDEDKELTDGINLDGELLTRDELEVPVVEHEKSVDNDLDLETLDKLNDQEYIVAKDNAVPMKTEFGILKRNFLLTRKHSATTELMEVERYRDIDSNILAKVICGMLNTSAGGTLYLGVKKNQLIKGIKLDRHQRDKV